MSFHVGQKVVCVNADPRAFNPNEPDWEPGEAPELDAIYTVTRVFVAEDQLRLWLAEIKRAPVAFQEYGASAGYAAARFRPLVTPKTDISVFTSMLTPVLEPV